MIRFRFGFWIGWYDPKVGDCEIALKQGEEGQAWDGMDNGSLMIALWLCSFLGDSFLCIIIPSFVISHSVFAVKCECCRVFLESRSEYQILPRDVRRTDHQHSTTGQPSLDRGHERPGCCIQVMVYQILVR